MRFAAHARIVLVLGLAGLAATGCGSPESRKAKYLAKGDAFAAEGNWEKARVEYRNALQIRPNDAVVRYDNGTVAEHLGNYREANAFYQGAIEIDPKYVDARVRLARIFLLSGALTRAMDTLTPALADHPDEPRLLSIRAAVRGRQKDTAGALADAERAYQLAPDNEDVAAVLAGTYQSQGRPNDSIATLEATVKRLPKSTDLRYALAQAYVGNGKNDSAEQVLKDIVALLPQDPVAPTRLAQFYAGTKRTDEAIATLRAAIARQPNALPLKRAIVQLIAQTQGADAAEKELRAQIAATPKDGQLSFSLADLLAGTNRPAEAEKVLNGVIQADANKADVLNAKGRLATLKARAGDYAAADKLIAEVLKANPRDNPTLALRAELAYTRGDAKGAIDDWRTVLRDQPDSLPAMRALARAHLANNEPGQAEDVLRRAMDAHPEDVNVGADLVQLLLSSGNADKARTVAEGLVKAHPDNMLAREEAFRVQATQKDVAAMQATAAAVSAAHPDLPAGDYFAGLAADSQGNRAAALARFGAALDRAPMFDDALDAYVRIALQDGKSEAAVQRLQKITDQHPKYAHGWQVSGETFLITKRYADAEKAFRTAIDLAPAGLAAYQGLSITRAAQNDGDGAIAAIKLATGKVTPPERVTLELAAAYERLGRRDDAAAAYAEVLKAKPTVTVAANNLAMLLVARGDPASLDQAEKLTVPLANSPNPQFLDTYGWVRLARGDVATALPALQKAVQGDPGNPALIYHLGMAQLKAGQTEAGKTSLQQALRKSEQFDGADQAKAALAAAAKS